MSDSEHGHTARPSAEDVLEITDALNRFAAGQDLSQPDLLRSAFADDAILDFVHPAGRLGVSLEPFQGRDNIAAAVLGATANLETTHTITNVRVLAFEGDAARISALIEAQHLPNDDPNRHLLLKNHLSVDLVRNDTSWLIRSMRFRNAWLEGDPSVLVPTRQTGDSYGPN